MNNTPQWREDLRELLYCIEPDVEIYFETQLALAREEWAEEMKKKIEQVLSTHRESHSKECISDTFVNWRFWEVKDLDKIISYL